MPENKLIKAYDDLMAHLYEAMDDSLHGIADALSLAKEKTSALGGHTQEEINTIADYVMRDVGHAASHPDNDLSAWLKFDIALIENFALDAFWSVADKTRTQWAALSLDAQQYHPYKDGDIVSPGTFSCDGCGKQLAFKSTSRLPLCPNCQGQHFSRC